ncbi:uncharacterized protein [Haliotis asinina]|uniref:uncharacterized protein n=1 Tax=Haliotis asinina TaxID=109174 RepID=UPI003531E55D
MPSAKNGPDYDRGKLRAYKSFQDYRLYADGHVNSVEYVDTTDTVVIFKASVKPTQRDKTYLKSEFYNLWIAVDKMNVDIKTAYCQCPGGSDGACRHIAATLFDIKAFEKKSITDGPSLWTKRPHDEPVPLAHLKVKKISYGQMLADTSSDYGQDTFDPRPISDRSNPSLELNRWPILQPYCIRSILMLVPWRASLIPLTHRFKQ